MLTLFTVNDDAKLCRDKAAMTMTIAAMKWAIDRPVSRIMFIIVSPHDGNKIPTAAQESTKQVFLFYALARARRQTS